MNEIIIYTNKTCPYCKQVKEELTKNNIDFTDKITSDCSDEWQEVVNLTGMATVPTVFFKDNYFVPGRDFAAPQQLIATIKHFKPSEHPFASQALERIKTLNFNISTAFVNLEKALVRLNDKLNTEENNEH